MEVAQDFQILKKTIALEGIEEGFIQWLTKQKKARKDRIVAKLFKRISEIIYDGDEYGEYDEDGNIIDDVYETFFGIYVYFVIEKEIMSLSEYRKSFRYRDKNYGVITES